jgi:hypothetical protein
MGTVEPIPAGDATTAARDLYLAKHPDAFWVDFGDFSWHRMDNILGARLIGGFARAGGEDIHVPVQCADHCAADCTLLVFQT